MAAANKKKTPHFRERANGLMELRLQVTMADGTREQRSFYGKTKTICKQKYEDYIQGERQKADKRKTVDGFAREWIEIKRSQVSYRTWKNYDYYMFSHVVPYLGGNRKLSSIKPMDIEKMMLHCVDLSDSSKHHILLTAKQMFKAAQKNGLIIMNPCDDIKYRKTDELKELVVYTPEEIQVILEHLHETPIGTGIGLMLYAGLRTEEVCALQWDDVNLEEDIITVRHVITVTEKHEYSDVRNTKSKKMRKLPIPPELHAILASSERVKDNPYVIPYQGGKRTYPYEYLFYTPNVYFERYEKFMKSLPIRYLSPHKLRHTYGTYLTRSGADLPSIQKLMGHSSVNTTRIYTDVGLDDQRTAVAKLSFS